MADEHHRATHRAAVCLVGMDGPAFEALRYLLTHMNELQQSLEFELVWVNPNDPLVQRLSGPQPVMMDSDLDSLVEEFAKRQDIFNASLEEGYGIAPASPCEYIILSLARLSNNYYAWGIGRTSLLALGGWDKSFAPPSLVEYALTSILRLAASDAVPQVEGAQHLATRGCVFDFNPDLHTVRLKVLNSFICSSCTKALIDAGETRLAEDLRLLLGKTWLGDAADPRAPAALCRKLGYDLFLTRGIQPTFLQSIGSQLRSGVVSELVKISGLIVATGLLIVFGWKVVG